MASEDYIANTFGLTCGYVRSKEQKKINWHLLHLLWHKENWSYSSKSLIQAYAHYKLQKTVQIFACIGTGHCIALGQQEKTPQQHTTIDLGFCKTPTCWSELWVGRKVRFIILLYLVLYPFLVGTLKILLISSPVSVSCFPHILMLWTSLAKPLKML